MSRNEEKFADLCLKGEALADQIDDFVDCWHESDVDIPLHEFLGLTRDEYALWVERPDSLKFILFARKHDRLLGGFHSVAEAYRLAAQSVSPDPEDVEGLIDWLRRTGRITA